MQLTTLLTSSLLILSTLATPLQPRQTSPNFRLTVFNAYPGTTGGLYGELDIEPNGAAVFNRTATPKIYSYALNGDADGPGSLFQRGTGKLMYLNPTPSPGIYEVRFAKPVPGDECILWERWTRQGRGCGGHCGGTDLKWDEPPAGPSVGTFFVVPHGTIVGAYRILYTLDRVVYPLPTNGKEILVWAQNS